MGRVRRSDQLRRLRRDHRHLPVQHEADHGQGTGLHGGGPDQRDQVLLLGDRGERQRYEFSGQRRVDPAGAPGYRAGSSGPADGDRGPGPGQVTLSWATPASSGVSPITGYDIYVGSTQAFRGGQPQFVSQGPGTSYVVKGLSAGATYYFKVAAVSAQGTGPASGVTSVMLPAQTKPAVPGAPGNVIAQPGRSRVIVMWTAPATSGGAKISGYLLYAGTSPGGESSTPVSLALIHDTATAVMGLSSSTKYYFKVAAVDSTGQPGALSVEVSAVPWPAVGAGSATGSQPPPAGPPASQHAGPIQASPDQQLSPAPPSQTAGPTQDQSSPGTPTWLIILLAAVAVAALTGASRWLSTTGGRGSGRARPKRSSRASGTAGPTR